MQIVFDIETDGLNPSVIWCLVAQGEHGKFYHFYEDTIIEGVQLLQKADRLIGHNILG